MPLSGRHPLHVARRDGAAVAHAVAVLHRSGQHVGDRLDAAVRMPGKAGQVVLGNVVAEIVEQQKRIEVGGIAESKRAAQMHARAFERRLGFDESLDRSNRHWGPPNWSLPYASSVYPTHPAVAAFAGICRMLSMAVRM